MISFALLVFLFLIIRLTNLTLVPIFADEAIYIRWAQQIWQGHIFIPLSDGKTPLFMWLLSPLLQLISDPLVAGRLLSIIAGLATLLGVYWLSKKLFSEKVALIASLLVIFQPFLLFYDRLSLVDSLLAALGIWIFFQSYQLFTKPSLKRGLALGLLAVAGLLTKPAAAMFLILIPGLLFLFPFKHWPKKIKTLLLPGTIAAIIAFGIYSLQRLSNAFHMINLRSSDYLRTPTEILTQLPEYFIPTFKVFFSWLVSYLSWPALVIFAVSLLLAIKTQSKTQSKKAILLSLWVLAPLLIEVITGKIIYPRYLLMIVPFILIIISWGMFEFYQLRRFKLISRTALITVLVIISGYWLNFDRLLLTNPVNAPLNKWEKSQYFYDWSAGFGLKEIVEYLHQLPQDQSVLVATEGSFGTLPNGLEIYFDSSPNIRVIGLGFPQDPLIQPLQQALAENQQVYLVGNHKRLPLGDQTRLKLIAEYSRPAGSQGQEKLLFFKVLPLP